MASFFVCIEWNPECSLTSVSLVCSSSEIPHKDLWYLQIGMIMKLVFQEIAASHLLHYGSLF
jgi:hypothetical protein